MTSTGGVVRHAREFMTDAGFNYINEHYNNLQGLLTASGNSVINPLNGLETRYIFTGDPESRTGWLDGIDYLPSDRRIMINTGPVEIAPGDTQNVVFALIFAQGTDRLNSVTELKKKAALVKHFYYNNLSTTSVETKKEIPNSYSISQNYPNPFNPTTKIDYSIPTAGKTKLVIYDILGREVKTLVNEFQNPGNYKINFDARNLSSGVYFYRLSLNDFSDTKKMILVK